MSGISRTTTDHHTIRRWTEARGGVPARVKGTQQDMAGLLRIAFPNHSATSALTSIEWDDFFEKFDAESLAFVYQETTRTGEVSRFNRLISRETPESDA